LRLNRETTKQRHQRCPRLAPVRRARRPPWHGRPPPVQQPCLGSAAVPPVSSSAAVPTPMPIYRPRERCPADRCRREAAPSTLGPAWLVEALPPVSRERLVLHVHLLLQWGKVWRLAIGRQSSNSMSRIGRTVHCGRRNLPILPVAHNCDVGAFSRHLGFCCRGCRAAGGPWTGEMLGGLLGEEWQGDAGRGADRGSTRRTKHGRARMMVGIGMMMGMARRWGRCGGRGAEGCHLVGSEDAAHWFVRAARSWSGTCDVA